VPDQDKKFHFNRKAFEEFKNKVLNDKIITSFRDPQVDYEPSGTLFGMPIVIDDSLPENTVMVLQDSNTSQIRVCRCGHPEEHHVTGSICALRNCACQRFTLSSVQLVPKEVRPTLIPADYKPFEPFDYDEFLEAITPVWDKIKNKKPKQAKKIKPKAPKLKVKVVKKQKERKLALDKDI